MEKIPMLKMIQISSIILCGLAIFAFIATYAREYSFFPYGIFSFESLWLWGIAILYAVVFSSFIALPFVSIIYRKESYRNIIFYIIITVIIIASSYYLIKIKILNNNLNFLLFFILMAGIVVLIISGAIEYYQKKDKAISNFIPLIFFFAYAIIVIFDPQPFTEAFKRFLTLEGLAAKNVEIYLKNENKFVKGTLRFSDSKYAYVEYGDPKTICNPDDSEECKEIYPFRKRVPITDVTILNSLDTQTQAKK